MLREQKLKPNFQISSVADYYAEQLLLGAGEEFLIHHFVPPSMREPRSLISMAHDQVYCNMCGVSLGKYTNYEVLHVHLNGHAKAISECVVRAEIETEGM